MKKLLNIVLFMFCLCFIQNTYAVKISLKELAKQYNQNTATANKKYLNKKVSFNCKVNEVKTTIFRQTYVEALINKDEYDTYFVRIFPRDRYVKKAKSLRKGQKIRVIGICKGRTLKGDLSIKECKILTKKRKR